MDGMSKIYQPFSELMPKFVGGLRVVQQYCASADARGKLWRIDYRPSGSSLLQCGVDYRGPLDAAGKALKVLNEMIGSPTVTIEMLQAHPGAKGWS
jgi:hypothetical protein